MEQKFKQFLLQFNGKSVEVVDATNLYQCFDLAVAFLDWLGVARSFNHLYAYQIYTTPTPLTLQNFELIKNSPDGVPQVGDIVVWAKSYNGTAGHVGIATGKGDVNSFECFEQNDPVGSPSHLKTYTYNHVLGWLRSKGNALSECLRLHKEAVEKLNSQEKLIIDLKATEGRLKKEKEEIVKDLEVIIKNLQDADSKSKRQLSAQQDEIEQLKKDKNTLEKKLELLQVESDRKLAISEANCQSKLEAQETRMSKDFELKEENYRKTISDLESKLKEKEIIIEKPPAKPKTLKEKILASIEIWF